MPAIVVLRAFSHRPLYHDFAVSRPAGARSECPSAAYRNALICSAAQSGGPLSDERLVYW